MLIYQPPMKYMREILKNWSSAKLNLGKKLKIKVFVSYRELIKSVLREDEI